MEHENGWTDVGGSEPRDEGEVAQDYQARLNAAGVTAKREEMARQMASPSLMFCVDCEGEIPAERREKQPGCTRCVECQSLNERLKGGM